MDMNAITQLAIQVGLKVLGAILAVVVGRALIGWAVSLASSSLHRQKVEATLTKYLSSALGVMLNIALVVAILGYFGFETTTFAAFVAAAGIAVGSAWSGLLAHFAAGVFLVLLRPIKAGDFITAGGTTGTVRDIGLFVTTVVTPDNVVVFIGNNKLFSDNIQNFSANPHRRVDLLAQLNHSVDVEDAIARLKVAVGKVPNIIANVGPDVEILEFNAMGPVLCVRPYTHTDNYWQVYFDTNRVIRSTFGEAGFPVPETHYRLAHRPV